MKTPKQILKKHIKRIPYMDLREYQIDSIIKVCIDGFRELLQQKRPKLDRNLDWNDGWGYDQKTITKLLEELE